MTGVDFNGDFEYDLELGQLGEGWVGNMLSDKTIEVKFDFACYRTGNFYIEYKCRGKSSGIATTKANYWMLIASTKKGTSLKESIRKIENDDILFSILIPTDRLKEINLPKKMHTSLSSELCSHQVKCLQIEQLCLELELI